jgi:hypothetical protein
VAMSHWRLRWQPKWIIFYLVAIIFPFNSFLQKNSVFFQILMGRADMTNAPIYNDEWDIPNTQNDFSVQGFSGW